MRRSIACIVLAASLFGAVPNARADAGEEQYRRLSRALVAPCCYSESLDAHRSPKADQARRELREMVAAGFSDDRIRSAFIDRYGAAVLIVPDGNRGTWLFLAPCVFALLALVSGGLVVRRLLRAGPSVPQALPSVAFDDTELDW